LAQQEFAHFDETRVKILKQLGALNEAGTDFELTSEARAKFDEDIKVMLEQEVEIAFMVVSIDMLGDAKVPPAAIGALADIVIIDEQPAP
jgi:hypothetical protein